jgi:ATP-dependent DNA helicase DinG
VSLPQHMTWDDFIDLLKPHLPTYKARPQQDNLARAASNSWSQSRHILAQAGCGTGKSFVAAFVAYVRAKATGQPVAIATATKALQDQYAEKDLPLLGIILPDLKWAVLKGRGNYVCLAKVSELEGGLKSSIQEQTDAEGFSGEVVDLQVSADVAKSVTTSSEECPGKRDCPFGDVCFAEKAKAKARDSHIVIANHAVAAADLAVKVAQVNAGVPENKVVGILPNLSGIVIDEAHELESSVTNALGGTATSGTYGRLSKEVANWLSDRHATDELNTAVESLFGTVGRALARRQDQRSKVLPMTDVVLDQLSVPMVKVIDALSRLTSRVESVVIHGDDKKTQQRKRLVRRLKNAQNKLAEFIAAGDEDLVRWLEVAEGQRGNALAWAPLDVSDFLRENLWEKNPAMLLSATLALGHDFSYIQERLGLD